MRTWAYRLGLVLIFGVLPSLSFADENDAKKAFDSLPLAAEAEAVRKTATTDDDVAFAAKLLIQARPLTDRWLKLLLLNKAYEFGVKDPAGYATAVEAVKLIPEVDKEQQTKARSLLTDVLRRQFRASRDQDRTRVGEELLGILVVDANEKFETEDLAGSIPIYQDALTVAAAVNSKEVGEVRALLTQAQTFGPRIKQLQTTADRADGKAQAKELALVYLLDLDKPAKALAFAEKSGDQKLQWIAKTANARLDDLGAVECLELGQWYHEASKARDLTRISKRVRLLRVEKYMDRYLQQFARTDIDRLKAKIPLDDARAQLDEIGRGGPWARFRVALVLTPAPDDPAKAKPLNVGDNPASLQLAPGVTMTFVKIEAGTFTMGNPVAEGGRTDEFLHKVKITKPFYMGQTEVTVDQFSVFIENSRYRTDAEKEGWGFSVDRKVSGASWRNPGFEQKGDHPVVLVSWNDAMAFCEWLSRRTGQAARLPSEAQWEYACRAGSKMRYSFGDKDEEFLKYGNSCDKANTNGYSWAYMNFNDGFDKTASVMSFKPNAWGLYDLHGNVWEWCFDAYEHDIRALIEDPVVEGDKKSLRSVRGGSWGHQPARCRSAFRHRKPPDGRDWTQGFRVALDAPPIATSRTKP